ncbi:DUF2868 domain-containing protein [Desulfococcaceae bacterium HSG9]|nr:DUF2868 domain-containing protein [Desulfococcaceae bacterium HSG9]
MKNHSQNERPPTQTDWQIKDLIDLEYFFEMDNREDDKNLMRRDREIYLSTIRLSAIQPTIHKDTLSSEALPDNTPKRIIKAWLNQRRKIEVKSRGADVILPGDAFAELRRLFMNIAMLIAFFSGAGLCFSLLTYKGSEPLNVSVFLGVLIVAQMGLIIILLSGFCLRRQSRLFANTSFVYGLLSRLIIKSALWFREKTMRKLSAEQRDQVHATIGIAHRQRTIYGSVFFWPFFIIGQVVGVGFNLGVLAAAFLRILSADLAFGWQSTIQISPQAVFKAVKLVALPWSWFMPAGIAYPTIEQIEGSHMVLKDGIYHLATQDLVSWWPFLCMAVCIYGLLPRILLLISGIVIQKRRLHLLTFDHTDCDRLMQRLITPVLETGGNTEQPDSDSPEMQFLQKNASPDNPLSRQDDQNAADKMIALIPDDFFEAVADKELRFKIKNRFGYDLGATFEVEADVLADLAVLERLADTDGDAKILLLQEAWQPPIRETLLFIRKIREIAGTKAKIIVAMIGKPAPETVLTPVKPENYKIWEQKIERIGDPYLRLEKLSE